MRSEDAPEAESVQTARVCTWCKEPFQDRAEQELHVSLLGAPGEFHRPCYQEYLQATPDRS